jgi:23S rRNA (pseudouridine1915-N3)-methyltransferase
VKILLYPVGRLKEDYFRAAEAEYVKRLRPLCDLTIKEVKNEAALLAALPAKAHLYALDERGDHLTSREFADHIISREMHHGGGAPVAFAIGGADGHSDKLRERATRLIAFGKLTIAHRLVRLLMLEQLYRAHQILRGSPYHRD